MSPCHRRGGLFLEPLIPAPGISKFHKTSDSTQCDNGVARVETKHSFLNLVVQSITFGLYSPMTIKVTCASGGMGDDADLQVLDTREEVKEALEKGEDFLVPTR